jgi:hypothetical protein
MQLALRGHQLHGTLPAWNGTGLTTPASQNWSSLQVCCLGFEDDMSKWLLCIVCIDLAAGGTRLRHPGCNIRS